MKYCSNSICSQINPQPLTSFNARRDSKDGLQARCKICRAVPQSTLYLSKREERLFQMKDYYTLNTDIFREANRVRYKENRDKIIEQKRIYIYNRRHSDINFRLKMNLRTRLNVAVHGNQKSGSAIDDLGCSIEELKKHLESKFQPGMTWDNWSRYGWHIDHIRPLSSFDLSDRKQFLEACYYTNLQPLWAEDNFLKGANMRSSGTNS